MCNIWSDFSCTQLIWAICASVTPGSGAGENPPGLWGTMNACLIWVLYSGNVIMRTRCPFCPPPRFDGTVAELTHRILWRWISCLRVGLYWMQGSISARKSYKICLTLSVVVIDSWGVHSVALFRLLILSILTVYRRVYCPLFGGGG